MESHDSFVKDFNRSPHGSATLPANMRYEPDPVVHRGGGGMQLNDYRQPFTPGKSSSPNSTPYHRSHDPGGGGMAFQTHAVITIPQHNPMGHRNSSPDTIYSPNVRSSYTSSHGTFSPEPPVHYNFQNPVGSPRTRPHSTPSAQPRGGTPPMMDPYQNQRNSKGIGYDKEMDLQEALMMDQDEGTLV